MINALLVGMFAVPFLASAMILIRMRRSTVAARWVALVASALTGLCAAALLVRGGGPPTLALSWLPGAGQMTFGVGLTSLAAALVTTWAAFLVLLGTTSGETKTPPTLIGLMLVALSAANVAFLSEHFLARYVGLEIAALSVALAPLAEQRGEKGSQGFWLVYVLLRLGDVGLLSAIKILYAASGTLEITPALEAGGMLVGAQLGWTVFGLLLAVWIKLGNWPLHVWIAWGRALSSSTQAWLYSTVMPGLGAYLLYRVTPILALNPVVQTVLLWLGAGAAMLAMVTALTRRDLRSGLVYIAAARGGLLVFAAASGLGGAVWLGLLATVPLHLLLFLTGEMPERGTASIAGRVAQSLFGLAGLALTGFGLLIAYWSRQRGMPLDALFVLEATLALLGIWTLREATRPRAEDGATGSRTGRWVAVGALGMAVLVGVAAFRPIANWLMTEAGVAQLSVPSGGAFLRHILSAPGLLLILVLGLITWQMRRRSRIELTLPSPTEGRRAESSYDLQEGLAQAGQALRAVVEVGLFEQIISLAVRVVGGGAQTLHDAVEVGFFERVINLSERVVVDGARVVRRFVEQDGLEGLLRRTVQGILELSRAMGRRHTGLLRRNLLWIPISLMVALVAVLAFR